MFISFQSTTGTNEPEKGKFPSALKCRSCRTPRYSPPVRIIKLTEQRELSPDEER
jgi:hypothetical protein